MSANQVGPKEAAEAPPGLPGLTSLPRTGWSQQAQQNGEDGRRAVRDDSRVPWRVLLVGSGGLKKSSVLSMSQCGTAAPGDSGPRAPWACPGVKSQNSTSDGQTWDASPSVAPLQPL